MSPVQIGKRSRRRSLLRNRGDGMCVSRLSGSEVSHVTAPGTKWTMRCRSRTDRAGSGRRMPRVLPKGFLWDGVTDAEQMPAAGEKACRPFPLHDVANPSSPSTVQL